MSLTRRLCFRRAWIIFNLRPLSLARINRVAALRIRDLLYRRRADYNTGRLSLSFAAWRIGKHENNLRFARKDDPYSRTSRSPRARGGCGGGRRCRISHLQEARSQSRARDRQRRRMRAAAAKRPGNDAPRPRGFLPRAGDHARGDGGQSGHDRRETQERRCGGRLSARKPRRKDSRRWFTRTSIRPATNTSWSTRSPGGRFRRAASRWPSAPSSITSRPSSISPVRSTASRSPRNT